MKSYHIHCELLTQIYKNFYVKQNEIGFGRDKVDFGYFLLYILFERQSKTDRQMERVLPCADSLQKSLKWSGLVLAKSRSSIQLSHVGGRNEPSRLPYKTCISRNL